MHCSIFRKPDGGISVHWPNQDLIDTMTGPGLGWSREEVDRHISTTVYPVEQATPYYEAMGFGGVTETVARDLIAARALHGSGGRTFIWHLEHTDLPAEQALRGIEDTFRDAWEWED